MAKKFKRWKKNSQKCTKRLTIRAYMNDPVGNRYSLS